MGIAVGPQGQIYVADKENDRIQQFTEDGAFVNKWDHPNPSCVTVDSQGDVYVGTYDLNDICKYHANGNFIWRSDRPGRCAGTLPVSLLVARFTDEPSYLLVASFASSRGINLFDPSSGQGLYANVLAGGNISQRYPCAIAVSPLGEFYVLCQGNFQVQKFSASGAFLLAWGSLGTAHGQFRFYGDFRGGLAVGSNGDVYVSDSDNHRIQVFSSAGVFLKTFGSLGKGNGQFNNPTALAFDPLNHELYVADSGNNRIQRFLITP